MEKPYKLRQVHSGIWLAEFSNRYDLAMTFCRYQEFYESSDVTIRNSVFTFFDFMEKYSQTYGESSFTYPNDWAGFNVPGKKVIECYELHRHDHNKYDHRMHEIFSECQKSGDFYLIGSEAGDDATYKHEIAHGLYYLDEEYRNEMNALSSELSESLKKIFFNYLATVGYAQEVWEDEIQAYMATDLPDPEGNKIWRLAFKALEKKRQPFIRAFENRFHLNIEQKEPTI